MLTTLATKRLEKPEVGQEGSRMRLIWFPTLRQVVKLDGWRTGLCKWHQRKQPIQRKSLSLFWERPVAVVLAEGGAPIQGVSVNERVPFVESVGLYSVTTKSVGSEVRLL